MNDFLTNNTWTLEQPLIIAGMTNIKILVADDRAAVRESLRTILSLEDDFEVVGEAENGRQAVNTALHVRPDIALVDLEMPDPQGETFDGVITCEQIKNALPDCAVVILTVHGDNQTRQRAAVAGCDLFLEKGINSFELLGALRNLYTSKS